MSLIEYWFIIGAGLILLELIPLPGIGLLFIGLGAITTGVLLSFHKNVFLDYQYLLLVITSIGWFLALWVFWKRKNYKSNDDLLFQDLLNQQVEVMSKIITSGSIGQVRWSGTIMNAKMINDETAYFKDILVIKKIKGNILLCCKRI